MNGCRHDCVDTEPQHWPTPLQATVGLDSKFAVFVTYQTMNQHCICFFLSVILAIKNDYVRQIVMHTVPVGYKPQSSVRNVRAHREIYVHNERTWFSVLGHIVMNDSRFINMPAYKSVLTLASSRFWWYLQLCNWLNGLDASRVGWVVGHARLACAEAGHWMGRWARAGQVDQPG